MGDVISKILVIAGIVAIVVIGLLLAMAGLWAWIWKDGFM